MRMKTFAMLTMSGLLAASLAYVAPALADDSSSNGAAMQGTGDGSQNNATNNIGADSMAGTSNQTDSSGSSGSSSSSSDEGSSPDQATGDEGDY